MNSASSILLAMTALTFCASACACVVLVRLQRSMSLPYYTWNSVLFCAIALADGWGPERALICACVLSLVAVLAALELLRHLPVTERERARLRMLWAVVAFAALGIAGAAWPAGACWAYRGRVPLEAAVVVILALALAAARRAGHGHRPELGALRAILAADVVGLASLPAWEASRLAGLTLTYAASMAYVVLMSLAALEAARELRLSARRRW